ncbi:MAG: FAD-dependent thymidylate synthase [Elusimicrobia bacterium]|nr:FAD-dependent thymidylate synthase [Elusimicrobiota bacterium]
MTGTTLNTGQDLYKTLDKGFVKLVEFMGGDQRAVDSARVSFGSVSKGKEQDKKLIGYLLANGHLSPFEHSVFQFHIKCPIFVARQWMRHRIACVTGDTRLCFDLPAGPRDGRCKAYPMTISDFYRKWNEGAKPIPHSRKPSMLMKMPQRGRLERMMLRNLDESAWTIKHTTVLDIFHTGKKPVFEVTLEDGKRIRCTQEHRFLFEGGWKTLKEATGLSTAGKRTTFTGDLPRLAVNGRVVDKPLYRDKEWLKEQYTRPEASDSSIAEMLGVSGIVIRKWRRIHGLTGLKPGGFTKGFTPWNKGKTYSLWDGTRALSAEHLEAIRSARSGSNSNFWRGGVSAPRAGIARWTTENAPKIFAASGYRCAACGAVGGRLHAHHIIPVWADAGKALDLKNLTTLCAACHRDIHRTGSELEFAEKLAGKQAVAPYAKTLKPKAPARNLVPHWVRISAIKYAGVQDTYDLTVEGPFHNYVANGIVTHNSYNEISARYTEVRDEFYYPEAFRVQDKSNRQGSVRSGALEQEKMLAVYDKAIKASYAAYGELLAAGAAREMARMVLPVAQYTQFHWTINARSLLNFISLRADEHAQYEIRRYADAITEIFRAKMPWTWEAWSKLNEKKPR